MTTDRAVGQEDCVWDEIKVVDHLEEDHDGRDDQTDEGHRRVEALKRQTDDDADH